MESPKTIDALLDDLRALSPNGAEYLHLMMDDLESSMWQNTKLNLNVLDIACPI